MKSDSDPEAAYVTTPRWTKQTALLRPGRYNRELGCAHHVSGFEVEEQSVFVASSWSDLTG